MDMAPPIALLPLRQGARVGVFGPSGIHDATRLEKGFELLRTWGFEPVAAPHLGARHRYLAGTDDERYADLLWALGDSSLDAAWLTRGGYGLGRILGPIPWALLPQRPVIGFSDATALFSAMLVNGRLGAIHGPVLQSLADHADLESRESLRQLLVEGQTVILEGRTLCAGHAEGPLVGGNLCVLTSLCGTPQAIKARDSILFLEEVGEAPYRVDRMLNQLLQAGVLEGARAVVLGEFVDCDPPPAVEWNLEGLLREMLLPLEIPVLTDLPVGHGPRNRPLPLGWWAVVDDGALGFPWGQGR